MIQTRGERNGDPGNIDRGTILWQGMVSDQSDSRFVVFSDPIYGIRALAKVLLSYYRNHGLNTIRGLINRWAPSVENDSASYINHVASFMGVGMDAPLIVDDPACLEGMCKAIILHENGRCVYPDDVITKAVESALA